MWMASFNGIVGVSLSFLIGLKFLEIDPNDILQCIIASNLAALVGIIVTLWLEKKPELKKNLLHGKFKTWVLLSFLYLIILISACPCLRTPKNLITLFVPLIFSTGFAIIAFGPLQDWIISRSPNSIIKPKRSFFCKKIRQN